jgi:hypothetical protein
VLNASIVLKPPARTTISRSVLERDRGAGKRRIDENDH